MIIHCPSCRCEIKKMRDDNYKILTSNFDDIPLQTLINCIRCYSQFMIITWKEKQ